MIRLFIVFLLIPTVSFARSPINLTDNLVVKPKAGIIINKTWPKVLNVCPGLRNYAPELEYDGIDDWTDPKTSPARWSVIVRFNIPEGSKLIPTTYHARGNTCFFKISRDGKSVSIPKSSCKSVCLDRTITDAEDNNGADLVLKFK
jgi:hypothetical protein